MEVKIINKKRKRFNRIFIPCLKQIGVTFIMDYTNYNQFFFLFNMNRSDHVAYQSFVFVFAHHFNDIFFCSLQRDSVLFCSGAIVSCLFLFFFLNSFILSFYSSLFHSNLLIVSIYIEWIGTIINYTKQTSDLTDPSIERMVVCKNVTHMTLRIHMSHAHPLKKRICFSLFWDTNSLVESVGVWSLCV